MNVGAPQISREQGLALVELAVILALVCILVSFAVPRFVTLDVETRSAATRSLGGDVRSQAAHAHALWLAQGQPDVIDMEGLSVPMQNGYPVVESIEGILEDTEGFTTEFQDPSLVFFKSRDGSDRILNCTVRYTGAQNAMSAPRISVDTTGC